MKTYKSFANENLDEAKKLIGTYSHGDNTSKVYKLSGEHDEGDPYHVKLFKAGKHYEPADYFTDDHDDAHGTAQHMVKEDSDTTKNESTVRLRTVNPMTPTQKALDAMPHSELSTQPQADQLRTVLRKLPIVGKHIEPTIPRPRTLSPLEKATVYAQDDVSPLLQSAMRKPVPLPEEIELEEGYLTKQHLDTIVKKHGKDKDMMQMVNNYHGALKAGDHEEAKLHGSIIKDLMADKELSEEQLDEAALNKNNTVVSAHSEADSFTKEYTAGNRGDYRAAGSTPADKKRSDAFNDKYTKTVIRSGFAGSGTTHYTDKTSSDTFEVHRSATGKGFDGTQHLVRKLHNVKEANTFAQLRKKLVESKMGEVHADIGQHMDKHINSFKSYGGTEALMAHASTTAQKIAKMHKIPAESAHQLVRDYIESGLETNNN